jgi:SAM-dependent methyltransferase
VKLDSVLPWGRNLAEYKLMFDLSELDLSLRILGCGDGPASFNAEMAQSGRRVVSADPIYSLSKDQIKDRFEAAYDAIISQCRESAEMYVWKYFASPDQLGQARSAAMRSFLADYCPGLNEGRYIARSLPNLDFMDDEFDLVLCSHLLFLYSEQLPYDFHVESIRDMCRVGREVRVFPILDLNCRESRHLGPLRRQMRAEGFELSLERVNYEFQRGGDQMLRIRRSANAT